MKRIIRIAAIWLMAVVVSGIGAALAGASTAWACGTNRCANDNGK